MAIWKKRERSAALAGAVLLTFAFPIALDQGYFRHSVYALPFSGLVALVLYLGFGITAEKSQTVMINMGLPATVLLFAAIGALVGCGWYFAISASRNHVRDLAAEEEPKGAPPEKLEQHPPTQEKPSAPQPPLAASPLVPNLTFTDSALLSEATKKELKMEIGAYSSYLERIGFPVLNPFPTIGTYPASVPSMRPGGLDFGDKSIHDSSAIRAAFGMYCFYSQIDWASDGAMKDAAIIYNVYFLESYSDLHERKTSTPSEQWVDALWDVRSRFGKNVTNKGLYLGFADRRQIAKIDDTNSYLANLVESGMFQVFNDKKSELAALRGILAEHGLVKDSQ